MHKTMFAVIAGAAMGLIGTAPDAAAEKWVEIGLLKCEVGSGIGMIITSKKDVDCSFEPSGSYPAEEYGGSISRIGLDIGKTSEGRMVWAVFAPSYGASSGKLEGTYGGISAEATVGYGLGANLLVGGFQKSIALQPLSLQTQQGIDFALGVAALDLQLQ